jgi:hypothetical protein
MKRSPSPRIVLAHLLPKSSTQSLLLFYLAILKLQSRATKTSRQGWRPSQRRSTSETLASMAVVLRGRRPRCISGPLYFESQRTPAKVYFGSSVFRISKDAGQGSISISLALCSLHFSLTVCVVIIITAIQTYPSWHTHAHTRLE